MKTAFLFMSYKIPTKNIEGVCTAVVENFDVKDIGNVVDSYISERKRELSQKKQSAC